MTMTYPNVQLLINNEWRAARGGATLPVHNPADGSTIGTVAKASTADLDDALAAAAKGFEVWKNTPAVERAKVMRAAAALLRERTDAIATLTLLEAPLRAIAEGMRKAEEAIIADPEIALDATAKQVPALADPTQRESAAAVLKATSELWLVDGKVSVAVDQAAFGRMGEFLASAGIIDAAPEQPFVAL